MEQEPKKSKLKLILKILVVIVIAGGLGGGIYFYWQYQRVVKNPDIITKQETAWVLERVNKLIDLPQDETPTVATVLDKEKLKDQDFFKKAENGDKLVVYMKAKKAVLYRSSINKIIEVAPVYNDEAKKAEEAGAITVNPKIVILNGTKTAGLTNTAETKIKETIANVEIVSKENAKKTDYTKTIVVDINGTMADQAKKIADALGGEVGSLPEGENKPDADILVIVAK